MMQIPSTPCISEQVWPFAPLSCRDFRYSRGCYLRISDKGNFKEVLREYAEAELEKDDAGHSTELKTFYCHVGSLSIQILSRLTAVFFPNSIS